jgi:soluble lytic murein transglycosylase-like protein
VPAALIAALIRTESAWQPYVVSKAGAIGLAQLMPATAAQLGVDPWDPAANVLGGARYLREQLDTFDDVAFALAAYNAGPHRVRQYGGIPPYAETQAYVARILERLAA